ncbi:MAG: hypothetical protein WEA10_03890 [Actinomycetota bacterium]
MAKKRITPKSPTSAARSDKKSAAAGVTKTSAKKVQAKKVQAKKVQAKKVQAKKVQA